MAMGALLVSACGARQAPAKRTAAFDAEMVTYACGGGLIAIFHDAGGPVLVDGRLDRVLGNAWRDDDGEHFLSFERVGDDRRQVAIEYVVPRDRTRGATVRTYDRTEGSHFKITAHPRSWRIRGEPSSQAQCATSTERIARGDGR